MSLLLVEFLFTLLSLIVAVLAPILFSNFFSRIEGPFHKLAVRRAFSVLLVAAVAIAIRLALLPIAPIPKPQIHDEFGHLLIADTFAHGRLTNPTHPMWIHFETFNEIETPTYTGFAQPGQGFFLFLGRILFGHPFWGVVLSNALACAALCWMLQEWIGPTWALYGALIAVLRIAAFGYWANSYWGGGVAAIGGALLLGALARIWKSPDRLNAIVFAIGLSVLANSRPFEGFVFSLVPVIALALWFVRQRGEQFRRALRVIGLPLFAVGVLAAIATSYYFYRVTGSPFCLPYQVHEQQYAAAPNFMFRAPHPIPAYHHQVLRDLYVDFELHKHYDATKALPSLLVFWILKAYWYWRFYFGPILTLPILLALLTLTKKFSWSAISANTRFMLILTAVFSGSLATEIFSIPHYAAPITCVAYYFMLRSMRWLCGSPTQHLRQTGLSATRSVGVVCLLLFAIQVAIAPLHLRGIRKWWIPTWMGVLDTPLPRFALQAQLENAPGQHVILVRYNPGHDPSRESVFNSADIDSQKIIWARDMGVAANQELLDYYPGRKFWMVNADEPQPKLAGYSPSAAGRN